MSTLRKAKNIPATAVIRASNHKNETPNNRNEKNRKHQPKFKINCSPNNRNAIERPFESIAMKILAAPNPIRAYKIVQTTGKNRRRR